MTDTNCLTEALKHFDAGRNPIPCDGKKPVGRQWQSAWRDRAKLAAYFQRNPSANLGLVLGAQLIDIEWDSPQEQQTFVELFAGVEIPRTPCFDSTRGRHHFFAAHPRLIETGLAVINCRKLGVRIGAGGKAAQTVIPPSVSGDGSRRAWIVSFDECEPAELPEIVVDRILAYRVKPVATPAKSEGSLSGAAAAMVRMTIEDHSDGSKRLLAYACRAVEHDLNDDDAIGAIREASQARPFPRHWSDEEVLQRLRDAEKKTARGLAKSGLDLWTPAGRTDAANGRRLAAQFGESIRWCDPWNKWLIWTGSRWSIDDRCAIEGYAKQVAKSLWQEVADGE